MTQTERHLIFCFTMFILSTAGFVYEAIVADGLREEMRRIKQAATVCPAGFLCLKPESTVCYLFDMSGGGWKPVSLKERMKISLYVNNGKASWMEAKGLDCYEREPKSLVLGENLGTLKTEYWQWKRLR